VRLAFLQIAPLLVALGGLGCHRAAAVPPDDRGAAGAAGPAGAAGTAGGGPGDGGLAGAGGGRVDGGSADGADAAPGTDPGATVGLRRLSDAEYVRTVADLLGVTGLDADLMAAFQVDPDLATSGRDRYDNLAAGNPIHVDRYAAYFDDAVLAADAAFASPDAAARILICAPTSPTDDVCAREILRGFGLRAWRRPLSDGELGDLVALVRADLDAGDDFPSAIEQAVVALLSSDSFLYRIELDAPASGAAVRPLTSYELASRLSYLLWSSMPDDELFRQAANDALRAPDALAAEVTRMLADPRADSFVRNFFGQWLGFRQLDATPLKFPGTDWSDDRQAAVAAEARALVANVIHGDEDIGALMTTDVAGDGSRKGYLGLTAFFATNSSQTQSSPVLRGLWVVDDALCTIVPPPPAGVPSLTPPTGTPRQQAEARANDHSCSPCHDMIDPVGLGLEGFDQIGRARTSYGAALGLVDDHGSLAGTPFEGEPALAALVAGEARFAACARQQALTYAIGRPLGDGDARRFPAIDARWTAGGHSIRALLAAIVVDDLFTSRRGEGP
jgi:hypothetical protein